MKTKKINLLLLLCFTAISFVSCKKAAPTIEGLWLVEQVQMGKIAMTPVARWTRLNADGTQTSGNGWLQHSYGTYSLNGTSLQIEDKNGIRDITDPFEVEILENHMTWRRTEQGEEVIVNLKRIQELPQSDGNKVIGLWKLLKSTDDGNDITAMVNPDGKSMLQLGWDNRYVQFNMPQGKKYGIYKIHGHRPEIQLVNYGNQPQFSFWNFNVAEDTLILTSTDQKSTMEFKRIHTYLE